jgi:3-hydroxymyristoyl/3-hydroxydecanoyl-(acyl carrier protein) dehydratase
MKTIDSFKISANHPCLPGHFPGNPIVPGVVLLEQLESMVEKHLADWKVIELIQIKFLSPVLPEQMIEVEIDLNRLHEHKTLSFNLHHVVSGQKKVTGKFKCAEFKNG